MRPVAWENTGKPVLLVTGASSGAQTINQAMMELAQRGALVDWKVLHLTGLGKADKVRETYEHYGVESDVREYVDAMGTAWAQADLAISRAGAGSVGEAVMNGVPTIFLPYPYHRDQHQRYNAKPYAEIGGAVVVRDEINPIFNADCLAKQLAAFASDPQRLDMMRQVLQVHAVPDGAAVIARAIREYLSDSGL